MKHYKHSSGFTLIELMIVVAVVAILAAIAYPSYQSYVLKSRRAEAISTLQGLALKQEKFRANNTSYATSVTDLCDWIDDGDNTNNTCTDANAYDIVDSGTTRYDVTIAGGANTYTLTADPQGDQANDKQSGTDCDPLTMNQNNTATPAACWRK